MSSEAVATIVCTCKQTRFDIGSPNYRDVSLPIHPLSRYLRGADWHVPAQLDIEGLNITVTSKAGPAAKGKTKKSRGEGTEILNNAKLRLKASQRYALVGRNGTGKSSRSPSLPASLALHGCCRGIMLTGGSAPEGDCREAHSWDPRRDPGRHPPADECRGCGRK